MSTKYYDVKEVAEELRSSLETVRRWIKRSELQAINLGGSYLIKEEDLNLFLESRRQAKLNSINIVEEIEKDGKEVKVDTFSGHQFGEIVSNSEISKNFGVDVVKGIRVNKGRNHAVVTTDINFINKFNIYPDIYDSTNDLEKHTLYYIGEGKQEDQDINSIGNTFLRDSKINNSKIYVFQYLGPNEYQYAGIFEFNAISEAMQPDKNGKLRRVYIFKLKPQLI